MVDRSSKSNLRVTLTYGGVTYSGFERMEKSDHTRNSGRHTAAGAAGDIVTVAYTRTGGAHTLKKRFDRDEYRALRAVTNPDCTFSEVLVDHDGFVIDTLATYTGAVVEISTDGLEAGSGDPIGMSIKIEADGEIK